MAKLLEFGKFNIENMDIVKPLENKFHTKVLVRNDGKCAALAEKEIGSIKNCDDAVFLTLGTGIGGAVFMNGQMLHAKKKAAFELGHIVIDINGLKCSCGRCGCFETLASMGKFKNDIKERLNLNSETTGKEIRELIEDTKIYNTIEDIINKYVYNLSVGIKNLITIFEPEVISIGGSFAYYENILFDKLKNELKGKDDIPKIVMATLKNDAGIIGATII